MKKMLYGIIAAAMIPTFTSCGDPAGTPTDTPEEGAMTISVDKTQIEADGKDIATFTITDHTGKIITTEANKGTIFFKNVKDETRLPRYSTGFTSIADGEFEFVGIFNGEETANTVKIKAVNRSKYEMFHKNVAIFKLTGTWCVNCPRMTTALHSLGEDAMDHSIVLACHNEEKGHPFRVDYAGGDLASAVFRQMGEGNAAFPTNCYDMASLNTSSSTVTITDEIMTRRIEAPAAVGIKISKVAMDGTKLMVDASVKAGATGTYDMVCALVADNLEYQGGYTDNDEDLYSNVVLGVSGDNFLTYRSASLFDLKEGAEFDRSFEFELGSAPSEEFLKNMRAVILVHKKNADGSSQVNNCAECGYGKTLDYRYN